MKCDVCGCEFNPRKKDKIIVKDESRIFGVGYPTFWDAFECPDCGCQIIARKHCEKVDKAVVFKPWNVEDLEHIEKTCRTCDYYYVGLLEYPCEDCINHCSWKNSRSTNEIER